MFFFRVLFSLFLAVYKGFSQLLYLGVVRRGVVWSRLEMYFFFVLKSSNCFPVKTHVFERFFIFCTFVRNHVALDLRLHILALAASLTLS